MEQHVDSISPLAISVRARAATVFHEDFFSLPTFVFSVIILVTLSRNAIAKPFFVFNAVLLFMMVRHEMEVIILI
jgi:hypothetical protein